MFKNMKHFITIVLLVFSKNTFACFAGNYEETYYKATILLAISAITALIGMALYIYKNRKHWKLGVSIPLLASLVPIFIVYTKWNICCDCGNGVITGSYIALVFSAMLLIYSVTNALLQKT